MKLTGFEIQTLLEALSAREDQLRALAKAQSWRASELAMALGDVAGISRRLFSEPAYKKLRKAVNK